MVALRTKLDEEESFLTTLEKVREVVMGGFEHLRYPFDSLVEELDLPRDISRSPLFDMAIGMGTTVFDGDGISVADGLAIEKLQKAHVVSKYDLTLTFKDAGSHIEMEVEYNTDLYRAETITRWLRHFSRLLDAVLTDPGRRLGDIGIVSGEEEREVMEVFNGSGRAYAEGRTVTELLAEQVARTPGGSAVEHGDIRVSYGELWERSGRLAGQLSGRHGIGRNELVGILVGRSERMVIGIVGIIRSGGAYVPIDPEHPEARIGYILEQSKVRVVVTEERYREWVTGKGYTAVVLAAGADEGDGYAGGGGVVNEAGDLLYVMYTSGSTGRPKGVEIEHRSVVNFLWSMREKLGMRGTERLLAVTTYSFDISVLEMLLPLISGGTVLVLGREQVRDGGWLGRSITSMRPDMVQCTPGMWQMLLEAGWRGERELGGALRGRAAGQRAGGAARGRGESAMEHVWAYGDDDLVEHAPGWGRRMRR